MSTKNPTIEVKRFDEKAVISIQQSDGDARPTIEVKRFDEKAVIPIQQSAGDAGFDLAALNGFLLKPGETKLVPTGLGFGIPRGFCGIIKPKSSLLSKGISIDGVIDEGFTGQVKIAITNCSKKGKIRVKAGERIAQILFTPVLKSALVVVDELPKTKRGGSTGK
jgi:dUTP pyrophosphatase